MTVRIPVFQLDTTTHTGTVALKVADLEKVTTFYQEVIGLTLLKKSTTQAILGTDEKLPLLVLSKVEQPLPITRRTGLYHVAFLLPSRQALGDALLHYLTVDAPLAGASDHGYSEALYLTDPEGNGIEVYRDKPREVWDIREDGEIVGITIEMNAQEVIEQASRNWTGFPRGTKVGHVHLKVADLEKTEDFYTDMLGLSLKNNYGPYAKFFATGDYHHHIGSNIWMGRDVPAMEENDLGLDYYSFFVKSKEELTRIAEHWTNNEQSFTKEKDETLVIQDPNGITIHFTMEQAIEE